ncbi:hypothetical protein Taro_022483, partial [Colocasia esculenta]|nr:hypothetical protein [Colocasia esculenta]
LQQQRLRLQELASSDVPGRSSCRVSIVVCMDSQALGRHKFDQPCAACRLLHRKCGADCTLAPYFPPDDPEKFARVHKVFGASNVIKMLQTVEEADREDAVKSLVYEAHARMRDPVYGSTGALFYLQNHVQDLAVQLETTRAQILEFQTRRDQMLSALLAIPGQLNYPPVYFPAVDDMVTMEYTDVISSSLDRDSAYFSEPIQCGSPGYCQAV